LEQQLRLVVIVSPAEGALKMKTKSINKAKITATMKDDLLECDTKGGDKSLLYSEMLGVDDKIAFGLLLTQAANSSPIPNTDDKYNSIMPLLLDIGPQDALEGMLVVQMVATHNLAMEMARRALVADQTAEGVSSNVNRSTKLMNTFKGQVETLQKYRNKGQQTIQVQHVSVNDGGQAVVGNIQGSKG
jgi:hypothetical protein